MSDSRVALRARRHWNSETARPPRRVSSARRGGQMRIGRRGSVRSTDLLSAHRHHRHVRSRRTVGDEPTLRSRRHVHVPLRRTLPCSWDGRAVRLESATIGRARPGTTPGGDHPDRPTTVPMSGGASVPPIATVATARKRAPETLKSKNLTFPQVSPRHPSLRYEVPRSSRGHSRTLAHASSDYGVNVRSRRRSPTS